MKIHIVQKGDTLWKIAKKYGVSFEELKMLNSQLSNPDMIMPGTKIKVPTTGGHVIKEAPIAGIKKEMPIQHPHVKEMPKAEHPFVKEKPKTLPIKEIPKKEMPKKEVPKKEKPYTPKMPTPIIPEIDINNYYSMNMTNVDVDVDIEEKPQPAPKPIVKEKPPKMHVEAPVQQEVCPPIIPYQPYCYDVSPMMPGSGFPPGVCPPEPIASEQIPIQYETLPGVAPTNYQPWQDESSSCNDVSYPSQYGEVAGAYNQNPYGIQPAPAYPEAGNIPQEYYQQPLVTYGQMPAENGHVISQQYKQESSDYIGTPSTPAAPFQMPYTAPAADDCGCGAPFTPQPGYAYPEQGFSPQMGAYPFPENYGAGAPQGQPGFNP
ncbi:MAG: SafA/ExsA family spore coat assembly protein, partial [Bacillus sp. (in: firmicutes)]